MKYYQELLSNLEDKNLTLNCKEKKSSPFEIKTFDEVMFCRRILPFFLLARLFKVNNVLKSYYVDECGNLIAFENY